MRLVAPPRDQYQMWCASRPPTSIASYVALWGASAIGLGAATLWVASDPVGSASDILRLSFGLFGGMLAGCLAVRVLVAREASART